MPHAGTNHPEHVQSYVGALKKANVINIEPRVPKHPIATNVVQDVNVKVSEYFNVEIVEPDLVNEPRFSNGEYNLKFKEKTPSHRDLNYLPKRHYAPPLNVGKKSTKKKDPCLW